jgi:hypothetical protein
MIPQSRLNYGKEIDPERKRVDFRRFYSKNMVMAFNTFEAYATFCRCCIELPLSDNSFSTYAVCCVRNDENQKGVVKQDPSDFPVFLSVLSCLDFCPWATSKPERVPTSKKLSVEQIANFTEEDIIFYEGYNNVVRYACCCCPCTCGIPIPITKSQFDCYQRTCMQPVEVNDQNTGKSCCANLGCLGVICAVCCIGGRS